MGLKDYQEKRHFETSPEPRGTFSSSHQKELEFVVQEHHASHLHYDFRLEVKGILKSWAIPKGPSQDPNDKRLAIEVEDHPYEYRTFEGTIPEGNYGAGTVRIWDHGSYRALGAKSQKESEKLMVQGLREGHLNFILEGKKLKGVFSLIRLKGKNKQWLLMKTHQQEEKRSCLFPCVKSSRKEFHPLLKDQTYPFLSNLNKVYWPKNGYTKGDLLAYYEEIAPLLLPYLRHRPEMLRRYPNGIEGKNFYQKKVENLPDWIRTEMIQHEDHSVRYLFIEDLPSLLYVINLGSIDLHPFNSRFENLHSPDYLIIDLDPEEVEFDLVVEVAQAIKTLLKECNVPSVCKTSGGRGLHIYVPLGGQYSFEEGQKFSHLIAHFIHQQLPDLTSLERNPQKRQGKVYLDYLQNRFGQTVVAPYSVRPRPEALISTPLKWSEVKKGLDPTDFNIKTGRKRFKKVGDLFQIVLGKGADFSFLLRKIKS